GEGMDKEVMAKALDPFFTTKAVGKGSGMGLSQVYGFVRQMGGALTLVSEPGQGTQVGLLLPRARKEEPSAPSPAPADDSQAVSGRGNLLFVEDDPLVRETVRPALELAGFDVAVAENGVDALKVLESGKRIDLVFSDIVMPGAVSGIDLASVVQQRFPGIRIVLATGYSERRVALPHVRTLAKPYDIQTLVEALNDAVPAAPRPGIIRP
ncbi:MAG: response regulator, partial [Noviherbaspirillum sp.]